MDTPDPQPISDNPTQAPSAAQAPWLNDPGMWSTGERPAAEILPGWFCYRRERRRFVLVVSVSRIRVNGEPRRIIDLDDGRTLVAAEDQEVLSRWPIGR